MSGLRSWTAWKRVPQARSRGCKSSVATSTGTVPIISAHFLSLLISQALNRRPFSLVVADTGRPEVSETAAWNPMVRPIPK